MSLKLDESLDYVRDLEAGSHSVFFYRNSHEKHELVFSFLQSGFQNGEGAIYVAAQETPAKIRRSMKDFGLNVKALEKDGVLRIFGYDEWYIIDGEVNAAQILESAKRVCDEAMEIGLKGIHGCGETACFFEHNKEKELLEYELTIGKKLDLPVTALCAYDVNHAKSLDEKLFFNLIKAHGPVITSSFSQEIKFENFFPTITGNVLETIFGKAGKKAILTMLDERYSITPQRIAEDPNSLVEGLEELIGSGTQVITKSIAIQIHSKMGITQGQIQT